MRNISVTCTQFYSINDCHSLELSQKRYSFIGLQHPLSSAIHKQASVHARLFILQQQLSLQSEVVQRHVSSLMPDGTGGLVIRTEINLSLSNFYPFPSGEGTFWSDTRAFVLNKSLKVCSLNMMTKAFCCGRKVLTPQTPLDKKGNIGPHLHSQSFSQTHK